MDFNGMNNCDKRYIKPAVNALGGTVARCCQNETILISRQNFQVRLYVTPQQDWTRTAQSRRDSSARGRTTFKE